MKFTIIKSKISNPQVFLQRCGYGRHSDRFSRELSFVRRLGQGLYPRFHIYFKDNKDNLEFNLHLDQRPTRYEGQTAHAGEYEGGLVAEEINRIKKLTD